MPYRNCQIGLSGSANPKEVYDSASIESRVFFNTHFCLFVVRRGYVTRRQLNVLRILEHFSQLRFFEHSLSEFGDV